MTTRILVCGGRAYNNVQRVYEILDACTIEFKNDLMIIEGGATGADRIAQNWARRRGVQCETYEADWNNIKHPDAALRTNRFGRTYDASAGRRRNQRMLDEGKPDIVIAFAGHLGTADMCRRAIAVGLVPREVK